MSSKRLVSWHPDMSPQSEQAMLLVSSSQDMERDCTALHWMEVVGQTATFSLNLKISEYYEFLSDSKTDVTCDCGRAFKQIYK